MAEAKPKTTAQKAAPKKTTAAKAAPAKKPAAAKAAAPAKAPAKRAPAAKKAAKTEWNPGNEERYNMVQVAAYYLAERDSFAGSPVDYWIAAEAQITTMLPKK
jgi:hypothetical protein